MRKLLLGSALLAAISAGGCTTIYQPPKEPPPALWQGRADLSEEGSGPAVAATGTVRPGGVVVSRPYVYARTGRLAEPVAIPNSVGTSTTVPAGTPAYAQQFSLYRSERRGGVSGPAYNLNADIDPIEWCVAPESGGSWCAFWEGNGRVRGIPSDNPGRRLANPRRADGNGGPAPVITESDTDTVGPVQVALVLTGLSDKGSDLSLQMRDGEASRELLALPALSAWDTEGRVEVPFEGRRVVLTRVGPAAAPTGVTVVLLDGTERSI